MAIICSSAFCLFVSSGLHAASITNEGPTPVKVTGKTKTGIWTDAVLGPGETKPIRQAFLWVEHVPDGATNEVRICITENDGTKGYIKSIGGRYTALSEREKPEPPFLFNPETSTPLQPGFATNNSNVKLSLKLIAANGTETIQTLMPGDTTEVPQNTVEVQIPELAIVRSDQTIKVNVVMPDGSRHELRTSKAFARIATRNN